MTDEEHKAEVARYAVEPPDEEYWSYENTVARVGAEWAAKNEKRLWYKKRPWYTPLTFTDVVVFLLLASVFLNVYLALLVWELR
jgi:hypothetical protein